MDNGTKGFLIFIGIIIFFRVASSELESTDWDSLNETFVRLIGANLQYVNRTEWLQNGFPNRINSSISWDDGDMRFTINPSSASFDYFMGGVKYTVNTSDVENVNYIDITDTEGDWWIYYDGSTLTTTRAPTHATIRDIYENKVGIAVVFWDADNNRGQLMEDRHGMSMSPITHVLIHQTVGTRFDNGLALNNITTDQAGSADSHAQFGVEAGQIFDEDIEHTLNSVGSTTGLQIWHRDTSGWAFTTNAGFSMVTTGTGRLAYDNGTALIEVTNGDFVLAHVFATGFSHNNPVVAIGQAQYSTKKLAQEGALTEIVNILSIANIAPELKPIASVIFQTKNTFSNSVKAIIVSTDTGGDYVDFRTDALNPAFSSAQEHGNLAGLGDDDHTQYLLADGSRNATAPFTFNDNVTILGTLKGGSPLPIAGGLNLTDGNYYGDGSLITGIALQEAYDSGWINVVSNTTLNFNHAVAGSIDDYNVKIEVRENGTKELSSENGMIGLWHFNENAGDIAFDSTPNNNNGAINETCWVASKPVLRKALRFDNGSDTVGFGNIASFEYDDAFSLQAWVKTAGSPITQYVISKATYGSTKRGWTFYILKTGELGSFLSSNLAVLNYLSVHDNSSLDDDEWHHVALTYDGSSDASGVLLYVDGKTSGNKTTSINNLTTTMIIGESLQVSGYGGAHNIFSGIIDEVSVWNVTLTPAQVQENYNTTVTQYKVFDDYYQLNNTVVEIDTIDYPDRDLKVRIWIGQ